ncbi:SDR family NAD(P)-dependent oxidoreductase [Rhodococcus sp. NPDC003318]|uniref:SDR family NAD(P)-dependent oxidoreductase n=1 Tax=Rhodococcus sp. NPDC003318 TaxID=3364503 RepID=UPI0036AF5AF3
MSEPAEPTGPHGERRRIVVSGGTDGMGRALALARARRGEHVVVLGSSADKGRRLLADVDRIGATDRVEFVRVDLSDIGATRAVVDHILDRYDVVDALLLFANRQAPRRVVTADGLESTFALYYLSRYILGHGLVPALQRSAAPVIVNVAGTGIEKGRIHWEDLQLEHDYGMVAAQLQAGRANDLLGVAFAARADPTPIPYVLYHPGFTRSGDLSPLSPPLRWMLRAAARLRARPVDVSVALIHDFIDHPPDAPLTAIDRGTHLPMTFGTLDPADAQRLAAVTGTLLESIAPAGRE